MEELTRELRSIVGDQHVSDDPAALRRASADLSLERFEPAALLASPGTVAELRATIERAAAAEVAVIPRGAGFSYTRAHTPLAPGALLLDTGRLDRVVALDAESLHVTVEAGCSWEQLYLATSERGLRVPSWGPLSGRRATVGGVLSQNGAFFGAAAAGSVADSVLGLTLVLADGRLLRSGAAASAGVSPFARQHGPDLTGLFLADCGALAVKAEATLALEPLPAATRGASFGFDDSRAAFAALAALARTRLASDLFCYDAYHHELLAGLGFRGFAGVRWSVHALLEGASEAAADAALAALRAAAPAGARELDGSVAPALLANPFDATRTVFEGAAPGDHLPVHALLPLGAAAAGAAALDEFIAARAAELDRLGASLWRLGLVAARGCVLETSLVAAGDGPAADRARLLELRAELARALDRAGAIHFQLGKYYEYAGRLEPAARERLAQAKAALDPKGLLNPGALGL